MSNHARRRRRSATHSQAILGAQLGCAIRGCTCKPEFRVWHDSDGMTHTTVSHDDWCPAINPDKDNP
jgi:hypothetical protein